MRRLLQSTSILLLVIVPSTLMAGSPGAMLFPSGAVTLNGSAVARPTAVYPGDQIQTADGAVSMAVAGGSVQISPKSSLTYAPDTVTLGQGAMRVITTSGLSGRILNLSIHPASTGAVKYEVDRAGGKVLVAALEGKLRLSDGSREVLLDAGQALSMPAPGSQAPVCPVGKHQEVRDGEWQCVVDLGPGEISNSPTVAGLNLSTAQVAAITVGTIAAGTAVGFGVAAALPPASPAH